jgi:hypothetical protein
MCTPYHRGAPSHGGRVIYLVRAGQSATEAVCRVDYRCAKSSRSCPGDPVGIISTASQLLWREIDSALSETPFLGGPFARPSKRVGAKGCSKGKHVELH